MERYQVLQTLNGWSVVDTRSLQPFRPVYYVAYTRTLPGTGRELADEKALELNKNTLITL